VRSILLFLARVDFAGVRNISDGKDVWGWLTGYVLEVCYVTTMIYLGAVLCDCNDM
jgi:hypothetical protein